MALMPKVFESKGEKDLRPFYATPESVTTYTFPCDITFHAAGAHCVRCHGELPSTNQAELPIELL